MPFAAWWRLVSDKKHEDTSVSLHPLGDGLPGRAHDLLSLPWQRLSSPTLSNPS